MEFARPVPAQRTEKLDFRPIPALRGPCNIRNAGKSDAAASFRGNSGIWQGRVWQDGHGPAAYSSVFSNAAVLD